VSSSARSACPPQPSDGRGVRSVHVARQRETAERRVRDVAAKLAAAVTPPDDTPRLRL